MGSGTSKSRENSASTKHGQQNNNMNAVNDQNEKNLQKSSANEQQQQTTVRTGSHEQNGTTNLNDTGNNHKRHHHHNSDSDDLDDLQNDLDKTISADYEKIPKRGSRSTLDSGISRDKSDGLLKHEHSEVSQKEQEDLILDEFHQKPSAKSRDYPENYADKLRKQQQHEQVAFVLGREKTVMVRNPEEWNIDTTPREADGFDPNKFKAANRGAAETNEETEESENDNASPVIVSDEADVQQEQDPLMMSTKSSKTLNYDITEEELMESIANEYDL